MRRMLAPLIGALLLWSAAAHAQSSVSLGAVSTLAPPLQPGTNQPISLDPNGNLRVTCANCSGGGGGGTVAQGAAGASPWPVQDSADGSVAAGTAATKSALAGGVFNSALPSLSNGQQAALQTDSSGRLIVNVGAGGGTGGTSSNFAAAFPGTGTAIGAKNGANMVNLTADGSNNLNVNCQTGCNAASDTSNGPVAAGAAASTSKLAGLQFNTALPTLTNGQQAAAQADSNGRLIVNLGTAIPSGTNVIGQVGGTTVAVTVTPTITAAAYSAGQCVGGLMTFNGAARASGPGSGLVQSIEITDVAGQDASIDVILFNANPTNSTFTDHATCTVNNADLGKIIGTVHVTDCNLLGASAPGTCQAQQQAVPFGLGASNTTLWAVNISRGTPTYNATSNIADRLAFLQD